MHPFDVEREMHHVARWRSRCLVRSCRRTHRPKGRRSNSQSQEFPPVTVHSTSSCPAHITNADAERGRASLSTRPRSRL
jgi:hypothetical protein